MVRIGLAGAGFMGWIHSLAYRRVPGVTWAALSSRDPAKRAGDWRSVRGNFGPPGEQIDVSSLKTYADFDEMLADPGLDLIDVCTPTAQHPAQAIKAMRAGKHVLVEKAIALSIEQADEMLAVSRETGKLLMVAHVLPFFPEFAYAAEAAQSQRFGRLLAGQLWRVIARPDWSGDIGDAAQTGGPAVDLHIHDAHFVGLLGGVPESVSSHGLVEGGVVQHLTTNYRYGEGGPALSCSSGSLAAKARPFAHGFELYFERATLVHDSASRPLQVLGADGDTLTPTLSDGGDPIAAFASEVESAARAVQTGHVPALLSGQLARDALAMCWKEIQSVKSGRPVAMR